MPLSKSARLVLLAIQQQNDHSYAALQTSAGVARATLASALQELIAAGSITAIKAFGKPARYTITAPSPAAGSITAGESSAGSITDDSSECAPLVHSFSSSVVQKFNSSKVQFSALHDDENVLKENNSSSCNAQTSELLNKRAAFKTQILHLLDEYLIKGKKRDQLAEAIANLQDSPETILENVRKIRAGAVKRATTSPVGLTVYILSEYASTGQIALFDVPVPESYRGKGRKSGVRHLPQVRYTDEQRAASREQARQHIALLDARPIAKRRAEIEQRLARAQTMREGDYKREYIARCTSQLAELDAQPEAAHV